MSDADAAGDDGAAPSTRFPPIDGGASGGLAQARLVFLQGCGLPAAWSARAQWRILETGFGLGLNFLAAWDAWRRDAARPRLLHFVAIEDVPVTADDLRRSVAAWPDLVPLADALALRWHGLAPGVHRLAFEDGRVLLTLCIGEAPGILREVALHADAVFLDGFGPERPPQICSADTLKAVTRLCRRGAALAGWTVADGPRRELEALGWQLERRPGSPAGRESLAGRYTPAWPVRGLAEDTQRPPGEAVVIGAGLAGAAAAASLARRGWSVQVLDASAAPASGASALAAGLMAPHQSPDDNPLSRLTRRGIRLTLDEAAQRLREGIDWERTGVLEWRGDDRRPPPERVPGLAAWTREASADEKAAAGYAASRSAWWHANAGWVRPGALVAAWLAQPGVRFTGNMRVEGVAREGDAWVVRDAGGACLARASLVVVAAAIDSQRLLAGRIRLNPVRGQVCWSLAPAQPVPELPPFPVNGHGHFLPSVPLPGGRGWITGSTYGRGDSDTALRPEDDAANAQRLRELLPTAAAALEPGWAPQHLRSWSGVRCASSDRRPLVGELEPGLWVSTALGSRGLSFALLCAELLAARLHGEPLPVEAKLAQALDVARQLG